MFTYIDKNCPEIDIFQHMLRYVDQNSLMWPPHDVAENDIKRHKLKYMGKSRLVSAKVSSPFHPLITGGGGKVLSPWNISPRSTPGWVGVWGKNVVLPMGTNSGIFHIQLGKFHRYLKNTTKILGNLPLL